MAAGQKKARRLGAYLVFVDESGFRLIPTVCKTWAPRGHTPRISYHYRHDRISVISGVSLSAVRHRVGLYFRWHRKNIQRPEVVAFVRHLLRHLRGEVIVLWDNNNIHKGEPLDRLRRRCPRLHLEFTPAGSPLLIFEGTYTQTFANKTIPTPRYDYNQILYRLDLDDPALQPAQRR